MRVLLVEDDERTASFIATGLKQEGFAVDRAQDGEEGLQFALYGPYDVAVVDIMLPRLDGLTLIEELRKGKITTPILVLSAKGSVDDRVKGLHAGGDDYLVKPFAFAELLARIQALLRRASSSSEPTKITVGELSMDLVKRKVVRAGMEIELQAKELALLEFLMRNAGRIVSKTMIMEHVWDYNFDPQTNVVEARICRLRDKIDRPFDRKMIHTVRGAGYVLEDRG
ncbi:MAG: response regulator [Candidatus Methylomirabilales bacterium]